MYTIRYTLLGQSHTFSTRRLATLQRKWTQIRSTPGVTSMTMEAAGMKVTQS